VAFHQLPYWHSMLSYLKLGRRAKRMLRQQARTLVADHDAVMVRLPSLPAKCFAAEAWRQNKVLVCYLGGNILVQANPLQSPNPLVRLAARPVARYAHNVVTRILARSDVSFGVGKELYDLCAAHNRNSRQLITSLISEHDLFARDDTLPADGPIVIFRAARINPHKGTEYLLGAVHQLIGRGYDLRLAMAGGTNHPSYKEQLQRWCAEHKIADRVDWLGHVKFGPEMHRMYRAAHLAVLPSLGEGFPRFINESWAFSLPVVATDLPGLCPPVVPDENAVLVPLASSEALADAIARVIDDDELRRRIIRGGHAVARDNTAEAQSQRVAEMIDAAVRRKKGDAHVRV
jgi:glycosyltransferase involved in cell wall biosynthesis